MSTVSVERCHIQKKYLAWKNNFPPFCTCGDLRVRVCSFFKQRKKIVIYVVLDVFFVQLGKEIGNKLGASRFFLPVE
jgi:hypothetical protein